MYPLDLKKRLIQSLEHLPDDNIQLRPGLVFGKGWACFMSGKWHEALDYFNAAGEMAIQSGEKVLMGKIVYFSLLIYGQQELHNKQIELMEEKQQYIENNSQEMVLDLIIYASALLLSNRPEEAKMVWEDIKALPILLKNKDLQVHHNIMKAYFYFLPRGMLRESMRNVEMGIKYFVDSGSIGESQIYRIYLSVIKEEMGYYEESVSILKDSLKIIDRQMAFTTIPAIWIRLSINSIFNGEHGLAGEAIRHWESTESKVQANVCKRDYVHVTKALMAFYTDDKEGFWHYAREGVQVFEEKNEWFGLYQVSSWLSQCYINMGDTDYALFLLEKSLSAAVNLGNVYGEARSCLLIASIAYDQGDLTRAKDNLQKCLDISVEMEYDFLFLRKERKNAVKLLPFALVKRMRLSFVKRLLVVLGEECVAQIVKSLVHNDYIVRKTAINILSNMKYKEAEKDIALLLRDPVPEVRKHANDAMVKLKGLPPAPLKIYMLGDFRLFVGDREVGKSSWKRSSAKSILKYFIFNHDKDISRDKLIDMFHRDKNPESGWKNIRQAISDIRRVLEPGIPDKAVSSYLKNSNGFYRFILTEGSYVDCFEFEMLVKHALNNIKNDTVHQAISDYKTAVNLYKNDLLEEDIYEDWTNPLRDYYKLNYTKALFVISEYHLKHSEYELAIENLQKLQEKDEYNELVYLLLMKCHLGIGNRTSCIKVYEKCRKIIKDEFGFEPSNDLVDLFESVTNNVSTQN